MFKFVGYLGCVHIIMQELFTPTCFYASGDGERVEEKLCEYED